MKQRKGKRPASELALAPVDPGQRYKVDEAARYLRCGRATVYAKFRAGTLRRIVDGGRVYVPGADLIKQASP
jgi:excisionase family DNA binding protein